ncbi:MAG: hypothetical protein HOB14_00255 [Gammaproteobacteria bacterium]|jgi:hypothetical protein|nr:hypothetical protein [Gammaproteobacteria bacterium]MBT3723859.1 hypothetical protein [Gammaproteobacteria bacterium]MBT4193772.1 hypothetical protein [Gammaproteobacteria bacterium]MBT4452351.1 hypothetical protein [Gammaproteobacteria bacterium]MBT4861984.1 hypothetical protein [Gammaproteobacteria bacterium]
MLTLTKEEFNTNVKKLDEAIQRATKLRQSKNLVAFQAMNHNAQLNQGKGYIKTQNTER